ncbi:MAG: DUF721 domain-containing protein [Candidatus Margulisbacteria bacterium]|nr:DUF721 domain-containing protein [Candidatus Margulisiibacteriota bacterium]
MDNLKEILMKIKGLKQVKKDYGISHLIEKYWGEVFGKISGDLKFSYFREGIVYVEVLNPMWKTEIAFYKKRILTNFSNFIGKNKVKDVRMTMITNKKKEQVKKERTPIPENLKDRIIQSVKQKQKAGFSVCQKCHKVLVSHKKVCTFCSQDQTVQYNLLQS